MGNDVTDMGKQAAECMKVGDFKCVVSEMNTINSKDDQQRFLDSMAGK